MAIVEDLMKEYPTIQHFDKLTVGDCVELFQAFKEKDIALYGEDEGGDEGEGPICGCNYILRVFGTWSLPF